jgi:tetratricopeptide (TPR) repeat protein
LSINFSTQNVLIIDDMSTMRVAIKGMLQYSGFTHIDTAAQGEDALNQMKKKQYDIVICDYHLGDGKNGQQVLEQAKHDKLIGYSTIFIMITAENTSDMVMGAVEYRPDDYLTKPINKEILKTRLVNVIEKKSELESVDRCIRSGDYKKALTLCNNFIIAKPKYLSELLRMKADIALRFDDLETAKEVYQSVLDRRRLPWALTGLAQIHYQKKEYQSAIDLLNEAISTDAAHMEAHDLIAQCYLATNDADAAQKSLQKAIEISPFSILRQTSLGEVALKNGDTSIAEKAYRTAISVGRNSIYKSTDNYTNLAEILADSGSGREAIRVLKGMRTDYPGSRVVALQSAITETHVYKSLSLEGGEKTARETAAKLFSEIQQEVPTKLALDIASMHMEAGNKSAAMDVIGNLARNNYEDNAVIEDINALIKRSGMGSDASELIDNSRKEIKDLNNKAAMLFREGNLQEAMDIFRELSQKAPSNRTINMNSSRIHIEAAKRGIDKEHSLDFARLSLDKITDISPENQKYHQLMKEYQQLIQGS